MKNEYFAVMQKTIGFHRVSKIEFYIIVNNDQIQEFIFKIQLQHKSQKD